MTAMVVPAEPMVVKNANELKVEQRYNQKLIDAVAKNNFKLAERYIKLGANVNSYVINKKIKKSILTLAIENKNLALAQLLITAGALMSPDIELESKTDEFPLFSALRLWIVEPTNEEMEDLLQIFLTGQFNQDKKKYNYYEIAKTGFYAKTSLKKMNVIDLCFKNQSSICLEKIYKNIDPKPFPHKFQYLKIALKEPSGNLLKIYLTHNAMKLSSLEKDKLLFLIQSQKLNAIHLPIYQQFFSTTP